MCAVLVLLASLLVTVAPSPAGAAPPPNDDWTAATSLGSVPASTSGTSVDATAELDEPAHGSGGPFSSVWWSFTPASDDIFTVDTCGSAFDTVLAVYVGPSLDSLTQIGASDDDCGLQSSVTFAGTAGSPYWIAVDGVSGATGAIDLALDLGTPTGLRGTVTDRGSTPLSGVTVTATAAGEPPATTTTDVSGEYQFVDLAPGDWTVHFDPAAPHVAEYHDDAHSPDLATPVPVSAAGMSTGVDASLGSTCTSVQDAGCFLVSDVACFVGVPLAAQHTWQLYWEDGRCGDASAVDWSSTEGHAEVGQGSVVQLPSGTSLTLTGCAALGGSTYCDSATFEVGEDTHGLLRVKTSPPLPSQVVVDGVPRNDWGLDWVTVPVGHHQVCFTDVAGYGTPPCELVAVAEGATTALDGVFTELGLLKVEVDPAGLPATIFVDGVPRNAYGSFAWMEPGTYDVCWGDVTGYAAPACQVATVNAGTQTTVTGTFTPDAGSPIGPAPDLDPSGLLRVTTSPGVGARIVVDGVPRNDWGLDWVEVPVGQHQVCFTDVTGHAAPACERIAVSEDATTTVTGSFTELGLLKVEVDPAGLAVDVLVDGLPANQYGSFAWRTPGTHEVCWEDAAGYTTPACQAPSVTAGTQTTVTGTFTSTGP